MSSQTDHHTQQQIERYSAFLIHLFESASHRARDEDYTRWTFYENIKFSYSCQYPEDSLNHIIATHFDHIYRQGLPLKQGFEEVPNILSLYDFIGTEGEGLIPLVLQSSDKLEFNRCVKIFVRYKGFYNFMEFFKSHFENLIPTIEGTEPDFKKDKVLSKNRQALVKRRKNDGFTCLSMEESLALLRLLREYNFILKDEFMTNDLAAYAFHLLSGYSKNTLRQDLSKPYYHKEPLKTLQERLKMLVHQIDVKLNDEHGNVVSNRTRKDMERNRGSN